MQVNRCCNHFLFLFNVSNEDLYISSKLFFQSFILKRKLSSQWITINHQFQMIERNIPHLKMMLKDCEASPPKLHNAEHTRIRS